MAFKDRLYDKPVIGTALRVQDRYKADAADQLAASIGFFGFLSLFPLIIIAVAVGGFVVRNTPGLEVDVVSTIRDAIPGLSGLAGTNLEGVVSDVAQHAGTIAGIGVVTLLLSGLRVVNGAMVATTRVFHMPEPKGLKGWGRKLGALVLLGALALAGTAAAGVVGIPIAGVPAVVRTVFGVLVTLVLDVALFLVSYRILAAGDGPPWRDLLPGALLAGVGWTALKTVGGTWVANQAASANELYGTLGGIIALLLLFYLAGRLFLYGAELSAVLHPVDADDADEDRAPIAFVAEDVTAVEGGRSPDDRTDEPDEPPPPPPREAAPRPDEPAPTVSADTRQRLESLDRREHPADPKHAVAFALAVGAVAGLVGALKPWERDDAGP